MCTSSVLSSARLARRCSRAISFFGAVGRRTGDDRRADAVAVRGVVEHWQEALETLGFLDPATPRKLMARLHRLALRAELEVEEVHILRGIARAISERCR